MKILKRIAVIFMIILVIVIVAVIVTTTRISRRGLPDYNEELVLKGLENPVTAYRDKYGIPHIYAKSEHDLYLVTGYLMAQDRLWQMDLLRRVTLGRLSEIFGDDFIETDLLLRSLRYGEKSESIIKEIDPAILETITAYCQGVNQYIEKNKGNYPFEFVLLGYEPEPWEPVHSFNLIGYMAWDLKSGWKEIVLEKLAANLDSKYMQGILPIKLDSESVVFRKETAKLLAENRLLELSKLEQLGLDILSGSNNWAVSGSKSKSGKPLLANDMHLNFGIPGVWLQMHQVVEGKINCSGLALPGQPYLIVGHNDSIAWGMTNTYADNLDYYEERINPEDTNKYLYKGEWHNFELREETIKSKGGTIYKRSYRLNHRGPVISSVKGIRDRVITLHWVGDEPSNELRSIYYANRANNWEEFRDAFSTFRSISQNIAYADRAGNIGIYCCTGAPIRKRDDTFKVLPGWTDEYDWKGMIPFDELPHEFNPERGYISSANNRTVDDSYPYHISTWYSLPYRIDRIRELLEAKEILTIDDFKEMQYDKVSKFSMLFLERLLPLLETTSEWNKSEKVALNLLTLWDYDMAPEKAAATISELWSYYLLISVFEDEMGADLFEEFLETGNLPRIALYNLLHDSAFVWIDNIETKKIEFIEDVAIESFRNTVKELVDKHGGDTINWQWGKIEKLTLKHPLAKVDAINKVFKLNRGPFSVGGSYHTISQYRFSWFKPGDVELGPSHRSIYDLSNWDQTISVIPTGISGIPSSKFYCDQTKMYINGEYHPELFSEEIVIQKAHFTAHYSPE
jgi:penicillin G amidase